jgi:hypothetical protein
MSSADAAPRAAVGSARAAASRANGARSRGPRTVEGKARSARNALKHGLRAEQHVVVLEEDRDEFATLETALAAELAPDGALQSFLARRVARAAWRLARADRVEAELFEEQDVPSGRLGLALIRDGNGSRSFETLLRYRGAALAELWRALRTLKALQAEAAALPRPPAPPRCGRSGRRAGAEAAPCHRPTRRRCPDRRRRGPPPARRTQPGTRCRTNPKAAPGLASPRRSAPQARPRTLIRTSPRPVLALAPPRSRAAGTRPGTEYRTNPKAAPDLAPPRRCRTPAPRRPEARRRCRPPRQTGRVMASCPSCCSRAQRAARVPCPVGCRPGATARRPARGRRRAKPPRPAQC